MVFGTPGGIRTPDLRIRSPLLYPSELQALSVFVHPWRVKRVLHQSPAFCKMLGPIFHESPWFPSRHIHCNRSYCLETLCLRSKPKFEVKKCLAATYVMAAGSIGLKKIRHLRNLSYSKNIVMAHTWTAPDTGSLSHLGSVICQSPWSHWSVAQCSGTDCSQIPYTSCRIVSSTLACLA